MPRQDERSPGAVGAVARAVGSLFDAGRRFEAAARSTCREIEAAAPEAAAEVATAAVRTLADAAEEGMRAILARRGARGDGP